MFHNAPINDPLAENPDPFPVLPVNHHPIPPFAPIYVTRSPRTIPDISAPATETLPPGSPIVVLKVWKDYSYLLPQAPSNPSSSSSAPPTLPVRRLQLGRRRSQLPEKQTTPHRDHIQRRQQQPPHHTHESELQRLQRLGDKAGHQLQQSRRKLEEFKQLYLDRVRERQLRQVERRPPPKVSSASDNTATPAENERQALHRFFVYSIVEHKDAEPRRFNIKPRNQSIQPKRLILSLPKDGSRNLKPEPAKRSIIEAPRPNRKFELGSGGLSLREEFFAAIRPKQDDFENVGNRNVEFRGKKRDWEMMRRGESTESEEEMEGTEDAETEDAETEDDRKAGEKSDEEESEYDSLFDE